MLTMIIIITLRKYFPGIFIRFNFKIRFTGILLLCFILFPTSGFTQYYTYTVIKGNKQLGTLSVKCLKADKRITYSIWSEAKTGFIFNITVNVMIEEIFEMEEMEQSTFIRKINGIQMIKNTVDKFKNGYVLKINGNDAKNISNKINYSMGAMYFIEPENRQFVYSENYQQFLPLLAMGKNHYLIKFPDGNKSYYTYNNGMCTEVEAHTKWAVLFFKLNAGPSSNGINTKTKY